MPTRVAQTSDLSKPKSSKGIGWLDRVIMTILAIGPLLAVIAMVHSVWVRGGIDYIDFGLFVVFWAATLFGVEGGFHRYFSHRSFQTGRLFEALLIVFGSMSFQGTAFWWAANHRKHHKFADRDQDPHSPIVSGTGLRGMLKGVWHAHFGWNYRVFEEIRDASSWKHFVPDLLEDKWAKKVNRGYFWWLALGLVLPAALGGILHGSAEGAWRGFLWGGVGRIFVVNHGIYAVNSIGHCFGSRPFALHARDRSTNSVLLGLVTFGAGLHHNHHVFPASATNQIRWWEFDIIGMTLTILEKLGVVSNVRRHPPIRLAWTRRVHVTVVGDGWKLGGRLAGLTSRGAFIQSYTVGARCRVGSRLRLSQFEVQGFSGELRIPEVEVIVEQASWQGVGVCFDAPSKEFGAAIAQLRDRPSSVDDPSMTVKGDDDDASE